MATFAQAPEQSAINTFKESPDEAWDVPQLTRTELHDLGVAYDAQLLLLLIRKNSSLQTLQREWDCLFWPQESLNAVVDREDDDSTTTPLIEAVKHGREDVVGFLLDKGADAAVRDGEGRTALDWARIEGRERCRERIWEWCLKT